MRVCVVEFPIESDLYAVHLKQFLRVLTSTSADISIVTGNIRISSDSEVHQYLISDTGLSRQSFLRRMFRYIILQMRLGKRLLEASRQIDVVVSFHDYVNCFIPIIVAKITGKRVAIYVGGSPSRNTISVIPGIKGRLLFYIFTALENILFRLSDIIIPLSRKMISFQELDRYQAKISSVDGALFTIENRYRLGGKPATRQNIVSFVGRLSREKGILNFLSAIPLIDRMIDATFWIIGNGDLAGKVLERSTLCVSGSPPVVLGFIEHERLPDYLQQIKVLVVPSYSEGLPTIVLEAMACGAITVATGVGGVPDLIVDGQTGFLLCENSPKAIAETVVKALTSPLLSEIQENARSLVESNYIFESAVFRWATILTNLCES